MSHGNIRGRRLAAIMFTDMVGYSRLSELDETLAMELLHEHREVVRRTIALHHGVEIKSIGDGFLIEFTSVVEAVHCAVAMQTALFERNLSVAEQKKLQIRIGLHLGDVMDFEEDRYGNEVNIAARIEPFAGPGGICISQQVVDQIARKIDLPIRKLGRVRLKNIKDPVAVYRIVLPWESGEGFLSSLVETVSRRVSAIIALPKFPSISLEGSLVGFQVFGILSLLLFVLLQIFHTATYPIDRGPIRSIASTTSSASLSSGHHELVLPSNWQYATGTDELPGTKWSSFDPSFTLRYADQIEGNYLLKLSFTGEGGFRHPALVLGLVPDVDRVYLNGRFIGGSEKFSDLAMYSFDPSLIKPGETNTILIKAWTRRTLSPGLNLLPPIVPKIGEFEDVSREVSADWISFQVLRPIYLVTSLLIALSALAYCLIRKGNLKFLYFSGVLLLGSLALAYYNPFVANVLDYSLYRYIKLIALALSSFFLFSTYLHLRGLRRLEATNNFAGVIFAGAAAYLLLRGSLVPDLYVDRYNGLLTLAVGYGCGWLTLLMWRAIWRVRKFMELRIPPTAGAFEAAVLFAFGVIITLLCYSSILNDAAGAFVEFVQSSAFKNLAMAYPFAFAVMVLTNGLRDYTSKTRSLAYKKRKDDLILSIADLVSSCPDVVQAVTQIQAKLADFLKASRSTIYLAAGANGDVFLKASFVHGPVGIRERVEKVIQPRSGIIGYCLETRSAVFVEDISKDPRFNGMKDPKDGDHGGYRTGSFMIFPLILGTRLLGAITVADRVDNRPFTRDDFCLMHLLSKDLAFVISHSQLENRDSAAA